MAKKNTTAPLMFAKKKLEKGGDEWFIVAVLFPQFTSGLMFF